MRSRIELYDILVDELRIDSAKAIEMIDNAFALNDDETKKKEEREAKLKELKEKYVGKLLYIYSDGDRPTCIFVNDIKETDYLNYFGFVGPHIVLSENEYYFYSIEVSPLFICQDEFDKIEIIDDMEHIALSKKQFKQYLYYQLIGKRVENCMNNFIDECKIDKIKEDLNMDTLEKAARDYARIPLHKDIDDDERYIYNGHAVENYDTFKSGANWAFDTIFNWLRDNMDTRKTVMKDMLGNDMCLEYLTADFKSVDELIGNFKYDKLVMEE